MILDPSRPQQLTWHGHRIRLSPSQYRFLECLALRVGHVVTYGALYAHMYALGEVVTDNMLHWHHHTLQKWVTSVTGHRLPITNLARRGFYLDLPADVVIIQHQEAAPNG